MTDITDKNFTALITAVTADDGTALPLWRALTGAEQESLVWLLLEHLDYDGFLKGMSLEHAEDGDDQDGGPPPAWDFRQEDLQTFNAFDQPTRHLILHLIDSKAPSEEIFEQLNKHPQGETLSEWLLQLPGFQADYSLDDDEDAR